MARRQTDPIPESIRETFFACLWSVAAQGSYCDGSRSVGVGLCGRRSWMLRRHAIVCLWLTALAARFSELRRLQFRDLSIGAGTAFVLRSKRGRNANVHVSPALIDVTMDWRSQESQVAVSQWLICTAAGKQLDNDAFNRDVGRLFGGLFAIPLTSHCFRDTACQLVMESSQSVRIVQSMMGHRSAATTEHYLAKQQVRACRVQMFEPEVVS